MPQFSLFFNETATVTVFSWARCVVWHRSLSASSCKYGGKNISGDSALVDLSVYKVARCSSDPHFYAMVDINCEALPVGLMFQGFIKRASIDPCVVCDFQEIDILGLLSGSVKAIIHVPKISGIGRMNGEKRHFAGADMERFFHKRVEFVV